ncbi:MAG: hypothetical protein CSA62_02645 [Planctomycetota bacterium]|nr:MAG: hypothetical protein CSA62_02645 [Planctomycetota bacterium]
MKLSSDDERNPVEVLAEDFLERHRKGECPSVAEYTGAHPDFAEEIEALFPTMLAMERFKLSRESSRAGQASLGPHKLERLGDFELVRELGRGGMGVVFEAEQKSLGRRVAVKVLPRQQLMHERQLKRFEREARTAAGLHHTNIVPIFGTGVQDGFHYYVMQYISGLGLDDVVRELRKKGAEENPLLRPLVRKHDGKSSQAHAIARIGLQAASALAHAHEQQVLHRDIKPGNLLLDAHGTVWITDFGLAKALEDHQVSNSADIVGTLAYMAPEQFRGKYDERTDLYGLGLTLYELMTLQQAYQERDRSQLIQAITSRDPEHPRKYGVEMPADLVTIVMKCVARESKHRYANAQALHDDLEAFLEGRPIAARPVSFIERSWRWAGRNRAMAALSASTIVLLLFALVGGWVAFVQTRSALEREREASLRAEKNAELLLGAMNDIFSGLGGTMASLGDLERGGLEGGGSLAEEAGVLEPLAQPTVTEGEAAMLTRMVEAYEGLAAANRDSQRVQDERAKLHRIYKVIGDIRQRLGDWDDAIVAYEKSVKLYRSATALDPTESQVAIAGIYNEIGRVHGAQQRVRESQRAHDKALKMLEPLTSKSDSGRLRYEFVRTFNFWTERYGAGGGFLSEFEYQQLKLRRVRWERDHGSGSERRRREWRKQYESLVKEARRYATLLLRQDVRNPAYQLVTANLFANCARIASWEGEFDEARKELGKSLGLFKVLVASRPEVEHYRFEWAETLLRGSAIYPLQQRVQRVEESIRHYTRLAEEKGSNPLYRAARAQAWKVLASTLLRGGNEPSAERAVMRALRYWGQLIAGYPGVEQYQRLSHEAWQLLAQVYAASERLPEAISVMEEVVAATQMEAWDETRQLPEGGFRGYPEELQAELWSRARHARDLGYLKKFLESAKRKSEAEEVLARGLGVLPPAWRDWFFQLHR